MSTPKRHHRHQHPSHTRPGALGTRSHPSAESGRVPKRRRPVRWLLAALALVLLVILASWVWYSQALRPTGEGKASITIEEGEAIDSIATELKTKRAIRSPLAFKIHVRLNGLAAQFKAGTFAVSGQDSAQKVADALAEGIEESKQFTVKEGRTQRQVAEQLAKAGIVDEEEFANLKAADFPQYDFLKSAPAGASLEGFLFPETYTVPPAETSTKEVATIMLNQFGKELTQSLRQQISASGHTIFETVTVASLVEEEVKSDKDRRIVAGIIYKRLADGIRLDIDATTRYAVNKPTGALTQRDLNSDNPYNTRKVKGLPPGPIASPGLKALEATIDFEETDWLFYLSGPDGTTHYARTNDEHEENKAKYLR